MEESTKYIRMLVSQRHQASSNGLSRLPEVFVASATTTRVRDDGQTKGRLPGEGCRCVGTGMGLKPCPSRKIRVGEFKELVETTFLHQLRIDPDLEMNFMEMVVDSKLAGVSVGRKMTGSTEQIHFQRAPDDSPDFALDAHRLERTPDRDLWIRLRARP